MPERDCFPHEAIFEDELLDEAPPRERPRAAIRSRSPPHGEGRHPSPAPDRGAAPPASGCLAAQRPARGGSCRTGRPLKAYPLWLEAQV